jgi:4'-phosphopantetheinyl transferase
VTANELLPLGDLHVWFVDLNPAAPLAEEKERLLSAEELSRAARFVFPRDRRRYVGAHVALREILGSYLEKSGVEVRLIAGPHGKPSLDAPGDSWLQFNLAHSHEGALIACARGLEVGIDLEWIRENVDADLIVASSFSADERAEWAVLSAAERHTAFFAGWVRKEAYVKALGVGLSHPASSYTVRLASAGPPALLGDVLQPGAETLWCLYGIDVPAGYIAAAATPGRLRVVMRTWESKLNEAASVHS